MSLIVSRTDDTRLPSIIVFLLCLRSELSISFRLVHGIWLRCFCMMMEVKRRVNTGITVCEVGSRLMASWTRTLSNHQYQFGVPSPLRDWKGYGASVQSLPNCYCLFLSSSSSHASQEKRLPQVATQNCNFILKMT